MPANPKYLTQSRSQRFAKASAAIVGGFLVTATAHLAIAAWIADRKNLFITFSFSVFLLWVALMFVPYIFNNGWKCWLWYGGATFLFAALIYWGINAQTV